MRFLRGVGRWARDRRGNAAVIFAIALMPISLACGAAIDIKQHSDRKMVVQHALDMAGLAAARAYQLDPSTAELDLQLIANDYFDEELGQINDITMEDVALSETGGVIDLSVDGEVNSGIMATLGNTVARSLYTESQINAGTNSGPTEIVLVLDVTGSMRGDDRIGALKTGAIDFVEAIVEPGDDWRTVGIVPFAGLAKIDTALRGQSWLRVEPDWTKLTHCFPEDDWAAIHYPNGYDWTGVNEGRTRAEHGEYYCSADEYFAGPLECKETEYTWHGCVKPRPHPRNLEDSGYLVQQIVGVPTRSAKQCTPEIVPLTDNQTELVAAINGLEAKGLTYVPGGLSWGRRILSNTRPFDEGRNAAAMTAQRGQKILILMTDGVSTLGVSAAGEMVENNPAKVAEDPADELVEICDSIKDDDDIIVFTIAFDFNNPAAKERIRNCSSGPSFFFDAADEDSLIDAFASIRDMLLDDIAVIG